MCACLYVFVWVHQLATEKGGGEYREWEVRAQLPNIFIHVESCLRSPDERKSNVHWGCNGSCIPAEPSQSGARSGAQTARYAEVHAMQSQSSQAQVLPYKGNNPIGVRVSQTMASANKTPEVEDYRLRPQLYGNNSGSWSATTEREL